MPIPPSHPERRTPLRPADFPNWAEYYWSYQRELVRRYLLPSLRGWGVWNEDPRVLDIGCGDGGASCALAEAHAMVDGFDLEPSRLQAARERARRLGVRLRLGVADITDESTLEPYSGPYDLILLRDVLEHIEEPGAALANARRRLAVDGAIVVIFPPYWSPYGGHQQLLDVPRRMGLRWAKLPFAHWLPLEWHQALAGHPSAEDGIWAEIVNLRRCRLSLSKLRRIVTEQRLRVARVRHYLLRPSYRLRYGLPVLRAGPLGLIPGLREILVTGSYQLLMRDRASRP